MAELADRVLAWDRVAANRRNTRLLLVLLGVLLVPFLSGMTVWVYPWFEIPTVLIFGGGLDESTSSPADWARLFVTGLALAVAFVVVVGVTLTLFAVWRFGARRVLRLTSARPWPTERYPRVVRALENLCLGVGLPAPRLRLIDSAVPNALAVGNSPAEATIAVSRGLIDLLDERELEGVLAHELSHVANEDTRLATIVAAVVATLAWPVTALLRVLRAQSVVARVAGLIVSLGILQVLLGTLVIFVVLLSEGPDWLFSSAGSGEDAATDVPRWVAMGFYAWCLNGACAPFYILLGAPAIAFLIRRAVSRQREFLADADAVLLTRDPEGLALALAKIGAAHGTLRSAESIAHLFIAPPRAATRWFDRLFPTHPHVEDRIDMLARMGTGLDRHAVAEALETGRLHKASVLAEASASPAEAGSSLPGGRRAPEGPAVATADDAATTEAAAAGASRDGPRIPVYERPDGWSTVIVHVGADAEVALSGQCAGNFVQVTLPDGRVGWVGRAAPLAALEADTM